MPEAVNRDALEELLTAIGGDPAWVQEVFDMFVADTDDRIHAIEGAHASGDIAEVGAIAHGIKGAAAYLGAEQLRSLASDIERTAREGRVEPTPPHTHLRDALQATRAAWPDALDAVASGEGS